MVNLLIGGVAFDVATPPVATAAPGMPASSQGENGLGAL